jgi:hypothetical protein
MGGREKMKNSMFKDIRIAQPLGGKLTNSILRVVNGQLEEYRKSKGVESFLSWNSRCPSVINVKVVVGVCFQCFSCCIKGDIHKQLLLVKTATEEANKYNKIHDDKIFLENIMRSLQNPLDDNTTHEVCLTLFRLAKTYKQNHKSSEFTQLCKDVFSQSLSTEQTTTLWYLLNNVSEELFSDILHSAINEDLNAFLQACDVIYSSFQTNQPEQSKKLISSLTPYLQAILLLLNPSQLSILNQFISRIKAA